jgi:hypothetical protein
MLKLSVAILLLFISNLLYSQTNNPFGWLNGIWKLELGKNEIVETWQVLNDSVMLGKSYFVQHKKDSSLEETVELIKKNNSWFYIPTTVNQNNGNSIAFEIIFHKQHEFIAVNAQHDYPQRIVYRLIGQNLYASIEGEKNKKYSKKNFDYMKVN